jgi:MATE family multidrug resistance protein
MSAKLVPPTVDQSGPSGRPHELSQLARLAAPLVAGQAGNQLMSLVDTAMVGRLGTAELGGVGAGNACFFSISVMAMGVVLGTEAPISQALGAGEPARARRALWQGVRVAAWAAVPAMIVAVVLVMLLPWMKVDRAAAEQAATFVWARLPGMLPFLWFAAARAYLQAIDATRAIVIAMIVANAVNLAGNALLMYPDETFALVGLEPLGLEGMGVAGSALATVIAQWLSLIIVCRAIAAVPAPPDPARRARDPVLVATILRLGVPIGLTMLAEVGVFAIAGILAGQLGAIALAAHQVALTLASFTFTVAVALGSATSVLVGKAIGRGDRPGVRRSGMTGFAVGTAFMSIGAVVFLLLPGPLAGLLTREATVIAAAVPLLQIAAVFQISDGLQAVGAGALRGAGDPQVPFWANLIGHWAIGLPIAIVGAFVLGTGMVGLWWGLTAGLTAVAIALFVRFWILSGRPIVRV